MTERSESRVRTRLAPDVRRSSILDAATSLILRSGAIDLTMEEIAAEAGVARATLYLYFDSIDGIMTALRDRYVRSLIGKVEPMLATGGSGSRLSRLDSFVAGLARALHDRRDLHHALFHGGGATETPLFDAFRVLIRRFIADGRDAGDFAVPDLDLTTEFLLSGIHAVLTGKWHGSSADDSVQAAQQLARRTLLP